MRITVLGKSPSWQDADGACSGYLVEEDGFHLLLDCGNGVFSKLRRFVDYVDVDAVVHLAPARRPLPRPRAVLLRAHLRAAPAAGAGRPLARAPTARPVPSCTRRPAPPTLFRRVVGAWGNEDLIENAFDAARVRPRRRRSRSGRCAIRFQPVPHFVADQRGRDRPHQRRRPHHLRRRLRARPTQLVDFARDTDLLLDRGHAAAARARRARAATSRPARRASTPARPARGALVLTHFSDELGADWARARGRAGVRRAGRGGPRGRRLRGVSALWSSAALRSRPMLA